MKALQALWNWAVNTRSGKEARCPICHKATSHHCGMGACGDRCSDHGWVEPVWE